MTTANRRASATIAFFIPRCLAVFIAQVARGDVTVFFTRPISGVLLSTAIILLIIAALPKIRRRRDEVFVE
jgi:TctA family transporter